MNSTQNQGNARRICTTAAVGSEKQIVSPNSVYVSQPADFWHEDYTLDYLKGICKLTQPEKNCDSEDHINDTLYTCEFHNKLQKLKYCTRGCRENGNEPIDDHCNTDFLQGNFASTVHIEM